MKYLLTTTALGLVLAVTPAAAQDKPADQTTQSQAQQPGTSPTTPAPGAQPDAMQQPDAAQKEDMQKPGDSAQAGSGQMDYVQDQEQGDWLATDLIGVAVVNANNESIGDINDLLFDESGNLAAAVIGVGGFLGIGEKHVAVNFDNLEVSKDENDNMKVSLNITRESLESAPDFVSLEEKQAEQDRAARQSSPSGGGNPATGGGSPRAQ